MLTTRIFTVTRSVKQIFSSKQRTFFFNKKDTELVRVKDTTARDRAVANPQQKKYKEKGVKTDKENINTAKYN
ncbi:hypothetical protein Tco_0654193 [Tanacetum coccineum]|uniref:Ribosomal protein L33 n=1 Tax=Tanacetum coccineum TaxID=301880 RepID=A0ABQ4X2P0_9ASTR